MTDDPPGFRGYPKHRKKVLPQVIAEAITAKVAKAGGQGAKNAFTRVTQERDQARAEIARLTRERDLYLHQAKSADRDVTSLGLKLDDADKLAAGLVVELERQAKEKRAWNIDANNLKAEREQMLSAIAKAVEAMYEMSRRAHCPDLFDPSTRSRLMFEGARTEMDAALESLRLWAPK